MAWLTSQNQNWIHKSKLTKKPAEVRRNSELSTGKKLSLIYQFKDFIPVAF